MATSCSFIVFKYAPPGWLRSFLRDTGSCLFIGGHLIVMAPRRCLNYSSIYPGYTDSLWNNVSVRVNNLNFLCATSVSRHSWLSGRSFWSMTCPFKAFKKTHIFCYNTIYRTTSTVYTFMEDHHLNLYYMCMCYLHLRCTLSRLHSFPLCTCSL